MKALKGIGCVVYVLMGLVQLAAVYAGLEAWLHLPGWVSALIGLFVGGIPVIGTGVGIMGAIKGWGWSVLGAIAFFAWPYVLYAVLLVGGALGDFAARLFRRLTGQKGEYVEYTRFDPTTMTEHRSRRWTRRDDRAEPDVDATHLGGKLGNGDGDAHPSHVARLSKWVHVFLSTVLLLTGVVLGGVGVAVMDVDNTQGSVQWNALAWLSMGVVMVIASVILNLICMHKAWGAIQDGHARTTPGKAVGFMFIPLFNFYWVFQSIWGFAKDYNSFLSRHNIDQPRLAEWMYLVMAISFGVGNVIAALGGLSLLAYMVFLPIVLCSVCNAINRLGK